MPRSTKTTFEKKRDAFHRAGLSTRHAIEYGVLRAVAAGMKSLGLDHASAFNGKLWETFAPFTRRHQAALRHLEIAFPETSSDERERIARDVWNNLGRTAAEALMLDKIAADPSRIRLATPDVMNVIAKANGRVVLTSLHTGNWEALAPAFKAAGLSMAVVYQRVKNPHGDRYLRRVREKYFPGGAYPKSGATRKLISWLRAGNAVIMLADQRAGDVTVEFFGHPAPTTFLPAYMARSFDAPLIAARIVRTRGAYFDFILEEVAVPHSTDRDRDIEDATQALQLVFERWIREQPGQWMWAHRRWTHAGPPSGWSPGAVQKKTRGPKTARRISKT